MNLQKKDNESSIYPLQVIFLK